MKIFEHARWIWLSSRYQLEDVNQYAVFKTDFRVSESGKAVIRAAVFGNYACFINGKLAAFGQYTDFP